MEDSQLFEQERYLELFEKLVEEDPSQVFRSQLESILGDVDNGDGHFGVYVDATVLLEDDFVLGHLVLRYPEMMLSLLSKALVLEQERLLASPELRASAAAREAEADAMEEEGGEGGGGGGGGGGRRENDSGDSDDDDDDDDMRDSGGSRPHSRSRTGSRTGSRSGSRSRPRSVAWTLKRNVHARVRWLPGANRKPNISAIRSIDVNAFVQLSGTVTRSGSIKVLEAVRVFECNNPKCAGVVRVFASKHEVGSIVEKPAGECPTCGKSSSYTELKEQRVCQDYQEIKVQEQVQKLGMGSIPRSINVLVLHDLVDTCKAGDDVVITGVPIHRWSNTYLEERCSLETVIDANTVEVVNATNQGVLLTDEVEQSFASFWARARRKGRPMLARNRIVASICPQMYGLYIVKLAVALTLAGSPTFVEQGGNKVRGEPHLLLVGDAGTGKSQFLRYAAKLAARSVLTTGTGTTSAGLTCSAVKEGHEFMLEAGALVLADRGVCCIDEFGCIRAHDRATIHEAMEQQTLSVAKAGLVCSLKTRTTIIAATNPRGKYDPDESLSTNTGIAGPLLSRFDLVLVLLDKSDTQWDRTVSEFILRAQAGLDQEGMDNVDNVDSANSANSVNSVNSEMKNKEGGGDFNDDDGDGHDDEDGPKVKGKWSVETFQSYLAYVKRLSPQLTPEAGDIISAYYSAQRNNTASEAGRSTLRLLESLLRVAKAHARLMARRHVAIVDAVVSISLVEMSMGGPDNFNSLSSMEFPRAPDEEMRERTLGVLQELGLARLHALALQQIEDGHVIHTDGADDASSIGGDSDDEAKPTPPGSPSNNPVAATLRRSDIDHRDDDFARLDMNYGNGDNGDNGPPGDDNNDDDDDDDDDEMVFAALGAAESMATSKARAAATSNPFNLPAVSQHQCATRKPRTGLTQQAPASPNANAAGATSRRKKLGRQTGGSSGSSSGGTKRKRKMTKLKSSAGDAASSSSSSLDNEAGSDDDEHELQL